MRTVRRRERCASSAASEALNTEKRRTSEAVRKGADARYRNNSEQEAVDACVGTAIVAAVALSSETAGDVRVVSGASCQVAGASR